MNKALTETGSITMMCFTVTSIVIVLIFSSFTLFYTDYHTIKSNSDAIKAYYLAEAAIEESLTRLHNKADTAIESYLSDLHQYKIDFIIEKQMGTIKEYNPPNFNSYRQTHLLNTWQMMSLNKVNHNGFSDYAASHFYRATVQYDSKAGIIFIEGRGTYNNARKCLIAKVKPPELIEMGEDIYNLPKIKIKPLKVISYYQTVIL